MSHWTKAEESRRLRLWLLARMGHAWSDNAPTRCTRCGVKFSGQAQGRACPTRRRPNRWRLHWARARMRLQYPPEGRPRDLHTPHWWLREVSAIRRDVKRVPELQPDHPRYSQYWTYHKLARRYRRALRELWKLPSPPNLSEGSPPDRWSGTITRQRNELLKEARRTQARVIVRKGCTYVFYADAQGADGRPLFTEEEVSHAN